VPVKAPIRLNVSSRLDFCLPTCAVCLLVLIAALFSPLPGSFIAAVASVFVVGWFVLILDFSKSNNNVELTSVIFPDGRVQLESGGKRLIAGILDGQQWCTRHLAVLRVNDGDRRRNLVILSGQQQDADEFRRLSVWLRLDLCDIASAGLR